MVETHAKTKKKIAEKWRDLPVQMEDREHTGREFEKENKREKQLKTKTIFFLFLIMAFAL